jgi:alpha-tubulin suppressor-like RCC1 family protein
MTVGVNDLENSVNAAITTASTPLSILQLSSVSRDFDVGFVKSVACVASLPAAADNKGRMIYVEDVCGYRISDGTAWINDFTSTLSVISSTLYAWGRNSCQSFTPPGRLGDNTEIDRSSPVSVVGGFTDWCQVAGGRYHSLGLRTNGTIWAWGANGSCQLGDGTSIPRSSPVSVCGGFTNWCQISAGLCHNLAVRSNGTAWAWGAGVDGQLGNDNTINRNSPVSVVGGFTDWCQVSAGSSHSLGVRTNGTAWSWGTNGSGRLGDGCVTSRSSPVSVVGGFTDWCQVAAGGSTSHGLRSNGTVWGWGYNGQGRLGDNDGTVTSRSSPVSVAGGFTDWCQIAAGPTRAGGIRSNGTLWMWGLGSQGTIGDNNNTSRSSPVSVVGGFTDWCQLAVGNVHSLAIRTNGTAWVWGSNSSGTLGINQNTIIACSSPVSVVGGFTWYFVAGGQEHSLGITATTRGFA